MSESKMTDGMQSLIDTVKGLSSPLHWNGIEMEGRRPC